MVCYAAARAQRLRAHGPGVRIDVGDSNSSDFSDQFQEIRPYA